MGQRPLSRETLEEAAAYFRQTGAITAAARLAGLADGTMQNRIERAKQAGILTAADIREGRVRRVTGDVVTSATPGRPTESMRVEGDRGEVTKDHLTKRVRSLAELIRVCDIDTAIWEVASWECKAYQQASVPRAVGQSKQWRRPNAKPVITQLYSVSAKLRRKSRQVLTLEQLRIDLVADIRAEVQRRKSPAIVHRFIEDGFLFEFPPVDLHAGKYTWAEETVTDYDLAMAADLFNASLDFLLERALRLTGGRMEQALFVFGNDVSHIDSKKGQTTAGTQMDVDTRYIKVFRRICEIHRRAILKLREVCPVVGKGVPGNHDEQTAFHLGEILAAYFEGDKHVTIDNSPKLRKYHEFGVNLLGFTHGDAQKIDELPLTMAREEPEAWARCTEREWHIGHLHIAEKKEWRPVQDLHSDKGVRVRRLPSLSAHDAWHTRHGYMDRRACEAFLFHRSAGFTAQQSFNVDHWTGRPMGGAA